ncbi:hypothetical protein ENUP19_0082G0159 [Entamoeba nuttalli]|uniref:Uncharacterized protein n=2 Tax=Entamoeba nuttalli TaxID=412467 RepID=K2HRH7_ENTNP|nr:hypothetical protein ENU1_161540 [Entamoeba nuttalli P19]EKE38600.1 hypothetical protein ENU1_161540 [Entamoeba nuttalli P19]|eukprot:XP_008859070.1 hypothetical protein ENU1_161540 [Entamoeba nuttalli P19]
MDELSSFSLTLREKNIAIFDETINSFIKENKLDFDNEAIIQQLQTIGLTNKKRKVVVGISSLEEVKKTRMMLKQMSMKYDRNCIFFFDEIGYQLYDELQMSCFAGNPIAYLDRESKISNCLFGGNANGIFLKPLYIVNEQKGDMYDYGISKDGYKIESKIESLLNNDILYWIKAELIPTINYSLYQYNKTEALIIVNEYYHSLFDTIQKEINSNYIKIFYIPYGILDNSDPINSLFLLFGTRFNKDVPCQKNFIKQRKKIIIQQIIEMFINSQEFKKLFESYSICFLNGEDLTTSMIQNADSFFNTFIHNNINELSINKRLKKKDTALKIIDLDSDGQESPIELKLKSLSQRNIIIPYDTIKLFYEEYNDNWNDNCQYYDRTLLRSINPPFPNDNEINEFMEKWESVIQRFDPSYVFLCDEFGMNLIGCGDIIGCSQIGGNKLTRESRCSPLFIGVDLEGRLVPTLCCCPIEIMQQLKLCFPEVHYFIQNQFGITKKALNEWILKSLIKNIQKKRENNMEKRQALLILCESYKECIDESILQKHRIEVMYINESIANFCLPLTRLLWSMENETMKFTSHIPFLQTTLCFSGLKHLYGLNNISIKSYLSGNTKELSTSIIHSLKTPFQYESYNFDYNSLPFSIFRLIKSQLQLGKSLNKCISEYEVLKNYSLTICKSPSSNELVQEIPKKQFFD